MAAAALNPVPVVLGDKFGLYKTGQYSSDMEEPIAKIDRKDRPAAELRRHFPGSFDRRDRAFGAKEVDR